MKVFVSVLLLVLIIGSSSSNYQERQIYFNEEENVCEHGSGYDEVHLVIEVDGHRTKEVVANTHTHCYDWEWKDEDKIRPATKWSYIDSSSDIRFEDTSTYHQIGGELAAIIQKTTIRSPALINGKECDCVIVGNDEWLHYGANGLHHHPPKMHVSCTTTSNGHKHWHDCGKPFKIIDFCY